MESTDNGLLPKNALTSRDPPGHTVTDVDLEGAVRAPAPTRLQGAEAPAAPNVCQAPNAWPLIRGTFPRSPTLV